MKKTWILLLFVGLLVSTSCEKQIDDGTEDNDTEQPVTPPADDGGDDGSDDGGSDDGDDGGGGSDDGGSGGGGSDDGGGSDSFAKGTEENPFTVKEFLAADGIGNSYVVGYIIGDCTVSFSHAEFAPPFTHPQALLLADDLSETSSGNIMVVGLASGSRNREELNLFDNPTLHKRRIVVSGYREAYLGMYGIKKFSNLYKFVD